MNEIRGKEYSITVLDE